IVGQQITLNGTNAAVAGPRIDLLIQRAAVGECDLVVKGTVAGEQRGWYRTAAGTVQSDRAAGTPLSDGAVRDLAATADQELTYTSVRLGSAERMGVDRDEDGAFDRDEIDAGASPSDPTSVPASSITCSGNALVHGARLRITRNLDPAGDERLTIG